MIGFFRKLPLGTRYKSGFTITLVTGLIMICGGSIPYTYLGMSWTLLTIIAVLHFLVAPIYVWWERRWYRYLMLLFSGAAVAVYIETTLKVWRAA